MTDWVPFLEAVAKATAMATPAGLAVWRIGVTLKRSAVDPAVDFVARVNDRLDKVDRIHAELGVNGGATLSDKIEHIDRRTRRGEARLLALRLAQPEPMFEACEEGQFVVVNRALELLTGRSSADMVGMGWVNAIHHHDRDRIVREWNFAVRDRRAFLESCKLARADGRVVLVRIQAYPMPDAAMQDAVVGWHGLVDVELSA